MGNGRLRQGQARRGKAANRASEGLLSGGPSFLFTAALKKRNQVQCMHPSIHVKVQITPCPKNPEPPPPTCAGALSMPCTMRQVSFSPLLCKSTEQCYSMRRPRASHRTVWGRCELLQARAQGASRSCWLVIQAVILRPPLLTGDEHKYSTFCVLDDSYMSTPSITCFASASAPAPGTSRHAWAVTGHTTF